MCSAYAERDERFARDVSYGRDVPAGVRSAEHIPSLCGKAAKHHCGASRNITCAVGANITVTDKGR